MMSTEKNELMRSTSHKSHQVDDGEARHDEQLHAEGAGIVQREQLRGVATDHGDVGAR